MGGKERSVVDSTFLGLDCPFDAAKILFEQLRYGYLSCVYVDHETWNVDGSISVKKSLRKMIILVSSSPLNLQNAYWCGEIAKRGSIPLSHGRSRRKNIRAKSLHLSNSRFLILSFIKVSSHTLSSPNPSPKLWQKGSLGRRINTRSCYSTFDHSLLFHALKDSSFSVVYIKQLPVDD